MNKESKVSMAASRARQLFQGDESDVEESQDTLPRKQAGQQVRKADSLASDEASRKAAAHRHAHASPGSRSRHSGVHRLEDPGDLRPTTPPTGASARGRQPDWAVTVLQMNQENSVHHVTGGHSSPDHSGHGVSASKSRRSVASGSTSVRTPTPLPPMSSTKAVAARTLDHSSTDEEADKKSARALLKEALAASSEFKARGAAPTTARAARSHRLSNSSSAVSASGDSVATAPSRVAVSAGRPPTGGAFTAAAMAAFESLRGRVQGHESKAPPQQRETLRRSPSNGSMLSEASHSESLASSRLTLASSKLSATVQRVVARQRLIDSSSGEDDGELECTEQSQAGEAALFSSSNKMRTSTESVLIPTDAPATGDRSITRKLATAAVAVIAAPKGKQPSSRQSDRCSSGAEDRNIEQQRSTDKLHTHGMKNANNSASETGASDGISPRMRKAAAAAVAEVVAAAADSLRPLPLMAIAPARLKSPMRRSIASEPVAQSPFSSAASAAASDTDVHTSSTKRIESWLEQQPSLSSVGVIDDMVRGTKAHANPESSSVIAEDHCGAAGAVAPSFTQVYSGVVDLPGLDAVQRDDRHRAVRLTVSSDDEDNEPGSGQNADHTPTKVTGSLSPVLAPAKSEHLPAAAKAHVRQEDGSKPKRVTSAPGFGPISRQFATDVDASDPARVSSAGGLRQHASPTPACARLSAKDLRAMLAVLARPAWTSSGMSGAGGGAAALQELITSSGVSTASSQGADSVQSLSYSEMLQLLRAMAGNNVSMPSTSAVSASNISGQSGVSKVSAGRPRVGSSSLRGASKTASVATEKAVITSPEQRQPVRGSPKPRRHHVNDPSTEGTSSVSGEHPIAAHPPMADRNWSSTASMSSHVFSEDQQQRDFAEMIRLWTAITGQHMATAALGDVTEKLSLTSDATFAGGISTPRALGSNGNAVGNSVDAAPSPALLAASAAAMATSAVMAATSGGHHSPYHSALQHPGSMSTEHLSSLSQSATSRGAHRAPLLASHRQGVPTSISVNSAGNGIPRNDSARLDELSQLVQALGVKSFQAQSPQQQQRLSPTETAAMQAELVRLLRLLSAAGHSDMLPNAAAEDAQADLVRLIRLFSTAARAPEEGHGIVQGHFAAAAAGGPSEQAEIYAVNGVQEKSFASVAHNDVLAAHLNARVDTSNRHSQSRRSTADTVETGLALGRLYQSLKDMRGRDDTHPAPVNARADTLNRYSQSRRGTADTVETGLALGRLYQSLRDIRARDEGGQTEFSKSADGIQLVEKASGCVQTDEGELQQLLALRDTTCTTANDPVDMQAAAARAEVVAGAQSAMPQTVCGVPILNPNGEDAAQSNPGSALGSRIQVTRALKLPTGDLVDLEPLLELLSDKDALVEVTTQMDDSTNPTIEQLRAALIALPPPVGIRARPVPRASVHVEGAAALALVLKSLNPSAGGAVAASTAPAPDLQQPVQVTRGSAGTASIEESGTSITISQPINTENCLPAMADLPDSVMLVTGAGFSVRNLPIASDGGLMEAPHQEAVYAGRVGSAGGMLAYLDVANTTTATALLELVQALQLMTLNSRRRRWVSDGSSTVSGTYYVEPAEPPQPQRVVAGPDCSSGGATDLRCSFGTSVGPSVSQAGQTPSNDVQAPLGQHVAKAATFGGAVAASQPNGIQRQHRRTHNSGLPPRPGHSGDHTARHLQRALRAVSGSGSLRPTAVNDSVPHRDSNGIYHQPIAAQTHIVRALELLSSSPADPPEDAPAVAAAAAEMELRAQEELIAALMALLTNPTQSNTDDTPTLATMANNDAILLPAPLPTLVELHLADTVADAVAVRGDNRAAEIAVLAEIVSNDEVIVPETAGQPPSGAALGEGAQIVQQQPGQASPSAANPHTLLSPGEHEVLDGLPFEQAVGFIMAGLRDFDGGPMYLARHTASLGGALGSAVAADVPGIGTGEDPLAAEETDAPEPLTVQQGDHVHMLASAAVVNAEALTEIEKEAHSQDIEAALLLGEPDEAGSTLAEVSQEEQPQSMQAPLGPAAEQLPVPSLKLSLASSRSSSPARGSRPLSGAGRGTASNLRFGSSNLEVCDDSTPVCSSIALASHEGQESSQQSPDVDPVAEPIPVSARQLGACGDTMKQASHTTSGVSADPVVPALTAMDRFRSPSPKDLSPDRPETRAAGLTNSLVVAQPRRSTETALQALAPAVTCDGDGPRMCGPLARDVMSGHSAPSVERGAQGITGQSPECRTAAETNAAQVATPVAAAASSDLLLTQAAQLLLQAMQRAADGQPEQEAALRILSPVLQDLAAAAPDSQLLAAGASLVVTHCEPGSPSRAQQFSSACRADAHVDGVLQSLPSVGMGMAPGPAVSMLPCLRLEPTESVDQQAIAATFTFVGSPAPAAPTPSANPTDQLATAVDLEAFKEDVMSSVRNALLEVVDMIGSAVVQRAATSAGVEAKPLRQVSASSIETPCNADTAIVHHSGSPRGQQEIRITRDELETFMFGKAVLSSTTANDLLSARLRDVYSAQKLSNYGGYSQNTSDQSTSGEDSLEISPRRRMTYVHCGHASAREPSMHAIRTGASRSESGAGVSRESPLRQPLGDGADFRSLFRRSMEHLRGTLRWQPSSLSAQQSTPVSASEAAWSYSPSRAASPEAVDVGFQQQADIRTATAGLGMATPYMHGDILGPTLTPIGRFPKPSAEDDIGRAEHASISRRPDPYSNLERFPDPTAPAVQHAHKAFTADQLRDADSPDGAAIGDFLAALAEPMVQMVGLFAPNSGRKSFPQRIVVIEEIEADEYIGSQQRPVRPSRVPGYVGPSWPEDESAGTGDKVSGGTVGSPRSRSESNTPCQRLHRAQPELALNVLQQQLSRSTAASPSTRVINSPLVQRSIVDASQPQLGNASVMHAHGKLASAFSPGALRNEDRSLSSFQGASDGAAAVLPRRRTSSPGALRTQATARIRAVAATDCCSMEPTASSPNRSLEELESFLRDFKSHISSEGGMSCAGQQPAAAAVSWAAPKNKPHNLMVSTVSTESGSVGSAGVVAQTMLPEAALGKSDSVVSGFNMFTIRASAATAAAAAAAVEQAFSPMRDEQQHMTLGRGGRSPEDCSGTSATSRDSSGVTPTNPVLREHLEHFQALLEKANELVDRLMLADEDGASEGGVEPATSPSPKLAKRTASPGHGVHRQLIQRLGQKVAAAVASPASGCSPMTPQRTSLVSNAAEGVVPGMTTPCLDPELAALFPATAARLARPYAHMEQSPDAASSLVNSVVTAVPQLAAGTSRARSVSSTSSSRSPSESDNTATGAVTPYEAMLPVATSGITPCNGAPTATPLALVAALLAEAHSGMEFRSLDEQRGADRILSAILDEHFAYVLGTPRGFLTPPRTTGGGNEPRAVSAFATAPSCTNRLVQDERVVGIGTSTIVANLSSAFSKVDAISDADEALAVAEPLHHQPAQPKASGSSCSQPTISANPAPTQTQSLAKGATPDRGVGLSQVEPDSLDDFLSEVMHERSNLLSSALDHVQRIAPALDATVSAESASGPATVKASNPIQHPSDAVNVTDRSGPFSLLAADVLPSLSIPVTVSGPHGLQPQPLMPYQEHDSESGQTSYKSSLGDSGDHHADLPAYTSCPEEVLAAIPGQFPLSSNQSLSINSANIACAVTDSRPLSFETAPASALIDLANLMDDDDTTVSSDPSAVFAHASKEHSRAGTASDFEPDASLTAPKGSSSLKDAALRYTNPVFDPLDSASLGEALALYDSTTGSAEHSSGGDSAGGCLMTTLHHETSYTPLAEVASASASDGGAMVPHTRLRSAGGTSTAVLVPNPAFELLDDPEDGILDGVVKDLAAVEDWSSSMSSGDASAIDALLSDPACDQRPMVVVVSDVEALGAVVDASAIGRHDAVSTSPMLSDSGASSADEPALLRSSLTESQLDILAAAPELPDSALGRLRRSAGSADQTHSNGLLAPRAVSAGEAGVVSIDFDEISREADAVADTLITHQSADTVRANPINNNIHSALRCGPMGMVHSPDPKFQDAAADALFEVDDVLATPVFSPEFSAASGDSISTHQLLAGAVADIQKLSESAASVAATHAGIQRTLLSPAVVYSSLPAAATSSTTSHPNSQSEEDELKYICSETAVASDGSIAAQALLSRAIHEPATAEMQAHRQVEASSASLVYVPGSPSLSVSTLGERLRLVRVSDSSDGRGAEQTHDQGPFVDVALAEVVNAGGEIGTPRSVVEGATVLTREWPLAETSLISGPEEYSAGAVYNMLQQQQLTSAVPLQALSSSTPAVPM